MENNQRRIGYILWRDVFHAVWQVRQAITILKNFTNRSQYKQLINVKNNSGNCLNLLFSDINNINANNSNDFL